MYCELVENTWHVVKSLLSYNLCYLTIVAILQSLLSYSLCYLTVFAILALVIHNGIENKCIWHHLRMAQWHKFSIRKIIPFYSNITCTKRKMGIHIHMQIGRLVLLMTVLSLHNNYYLDSAVLTRSIRPTHPSLLMIVLVLMTLCVNQCWHCHKSIIILIV